MNPVFLRRIPMASTLPQPVQRLDPGSVRPRRRDTRKGFTLIEVLVVVALMGVLAAFAVPSLQLYLDRNRLRSYSNELLASLQYARSEALARNGNVRLCPNLGNPGLVACPSTQATPSNNTVTCARTAYFADGWKITTGTEVIRAIKTRPPNGMQVCMVGNSPGTRSIQLDAFGRPKEPFVALSILGDKYCRIILFWSTGLIEMRTESQTERSGAQDCKVTTL